MQFGTIALIDALGFRGIWSSRRGGPERARATLRAVRDTLEAERGWAEEHWRGITAGERVPEYAKDIKFSAHFMSDTAAIAAAVELPDDWRHDSDPHSWVRTLSTATMYVVCRALPPALRAAAFSDTAIAYRGAIACGEMVTEGDFTVGPAVDDAASAMEVADGAFVWLLPSALTFCRTMLPRDWRHVWERTVEFPVPLKGRAFRTRVVNPFIVQMDPPVDAERLQAAVLGTFESDQVDVAIKRQATADFLRVAREWVSTSSLAVNAYRPDLLEAVRQGLKPAAELWASCERAEREKHGRPITSSFPGTMEEAGALVREADANIGPRDLWHAAVVCWMGHPPEVP